MTFVSQPLLLERYGFVRTGPDSFRPRDPMTEPPLMMAQSVSFPKHESILLEIWRQFGQHVVWEQQGDRMVRWREKVAALARGDALDLDGPPERVHRLDLPQRTFEKDRIWINGELVAELIEGIEIKL